MKKVLSFMLAAVLLFTGTFSVNAAGTTTFADVQPESWYYSYVTYAYDNNFMVGKGTNDDGTMIFQPMANLTRAEFAQILYSIEGKPAVEFEDRFSDVENGVWYSKAVMWAADAGIVSGYPNGAFGAMDPIKREQLALMLYKYAQSHSCDVTARADISSFGDSDDVSSYALEQIKWANAMGIINGKGGIIDPKGNANRAECATMLKKFMETYQSKIRALYLRANKDKIVVNGDDTTVVFYLESKLDAESFSLYFKDNLEEPVAVLRDNGSLYDGDDMSGDGIYSGFVSNWPLESGIKDFVVVYDNYRSNVLGIECFVNVTDEVLEVIAQADTSIGDLTSSAEFQDLPIEQKKEQALELLENMSSAIDEESVSFDEDINLFSFQYEDGSLGGIMLEDFSSGMNGRGDGITEADILEQIPVVQAVGDTVEEFAQKVLILNCFPDFEEEEDGIAYRTDYYLAFQTAMAAQGIQVEVDMDVTLSDYKRINDYDVVVFSTHGSMYTWHDGFLWLNSHECPAICLSEEVTKQKNKQYAVELSEKQIAKVNGRYWILPSFFEKSFSQTGLDGTFVFSECCMSMGTDTEVDYAMANAITSRSAEAYVGFHNSVLASYSRLLMADYVECLFNGDTAQAAFDTMKTDFGENHKVWYEAESGETLKELVERPVPDGWGETYKESVHVAYPMLSGTADATLFDMEFENGLFEDYKEVNGSVVPTAWSRQGDVRSVTQLGDAKPFGENSKRAAIITTGVGSQSTAIIGGGTEGSYIAQRFRVPDNANSITFDYNLISEEPMEWVGSIYNDNFVVRIANGGIVSYEKMYESINSSEWSEIGNIDFSGGDDTVFETGWVSAEIDMSEYQGQIITLYFIINDVGDSMYDSACLLDNVVIHLN